MKLLALLTAVIINHYALGQTRFPADFTGHWEGNLEWYQSGQVKPQVVKMQLVIRPTDSTGIYTWQLIYGDKAEDNRPYYLLAVDTAKGHWRIDEANGIVLDQYWMGHRLTSSFTVGNSTLLSSYWRENDGLVVEFHSSSAKPIATTGRGTDDSPKVDSYSIKSYQRARLTRRT